MQEIHNEQNEDGTNITVFPLALGCGMAPPGTVSVSHKKRRDYRSGCWGKRRREVEKRPALMLVPPGSTLTLSPAPALTPAQRDEVSHPVGRIERRTSSRAQPLPHGLSSLPKSFQKLPSFKSTIASLSQGITSLYVEGRPWQPCSCIMTSPPGFHLPGLSQETHLTTLGPLESPQTLKLRPKDS